VKLKPHNLQEVADHMIDHDILDDEDWEEDVEGEGFGDLIQPGENFVVPTIEGNVEGVEFYICSAQGENMKLSKGSNVHGALSLKRATS